MNSRPVSDARYDEAMAALGRPAGPSVPPPLARRRVDDLAALFLAALFAVPAGLAIGYEVVALGVGILLAPGVLTLGCARLVGRPVIPSLVAAFASCGLAGLIGVPLLVMRIVGGIWA